MEYATANMLGAIPVLFIALKRHDLVRPMIIMGLLALPLALFDLLYMPTYWIPETLFNIPIGIEGFIFSFEAGALAAGIFAFVKNMRFTKMRYTYGFRSLTPMLIVLPVAFVFHIFCPINIAISMYIGLIAGTLVLLTFRKDLLQGGFIAAVSFMATYSVALLIWATVHPESAEWFTLVNLPKIFILNVPIYEIIFAFLFAFFWGNLYPYIFGYKLTKRH